MLKIVIVEKEFHTLKGINRQDSYHKYIMEQYEKLKKSITVPRKYHMYKHWKANKEYTST